jgi:hypothetical protein
MPVKSAWERVEDGMREVGTLLIAFAPLDAAFSVASPHLVGLVLLFLCLGALLFVAAMTSERRRTRAY